MSEYVERKQLSNIPRLPRKGKLNLTFRCNNNCLHCWVKLRPGAQEKQEELSLDEIIDIFDQARGRVVASGLSLVGRCHWIICF